MATGEIGELEMGIEVMLLDDTHRAAFAEFRRLVWGDEPSTAEQALPVIGRANPYERESPSQSTILVTEGRIVGHITSTPCKIWCRGEEAFMHWLSGFHLLPETRGQGLAKVLIQKMMEVHPVVSANPVIEASRRSFASCGWRVDWAIPEYVKLLDARGLVDRFTGKGLRMVPPSVQWASERFGRVARGAAGTIIAAANATYQGVWRLRWGASPLEVTQVDAFDEAVDDLWVRNRARLTCSQVRQSAYLNWLFPADRGWIKLRCSAGGEVLGYAIVAIRTFEEGQPLCGVKVASVIDFFWDFEHSEAARALLGATEELARQGGAHAMLASGTDLRARKAFVRRGFLRIPATVWLAYYSANPAVQLPSDAREWYANRGDDEPSGSLAPTV